MGKHGVYGFALLMVFGLAWLVGQQVARPLAAQQTGGLPALERRVGALEARVNSLQQTNTGLEDRLAQVDGELDALNARLRVVKAKTAPISVAGIAFTITGKNVFIQDGSGATASDTGLGNLTVGYNGSRAPFEADVRTGSHNLIVGDSHNYSRFGGLAVGFANTIRGDYASVSGGGGNTASGFASSVSGGAFGSVTRSNNWRAGELFQEN